MRRFGNALTLAALALLAGAPAHAYFEETATGARGLALGSSALAAIDDASAYYWNPAGLAGLRQAELLIDYAKPHGVEGLDAGALGAAGRAAGFGWAVAWHRLAISHVYAEDQFDLAAARPVANVAGGRLDAGATFKFGRVSFQSFADPLTGESVDYGAQSKGSLDGGLLWHSPWNIDFAWTGRDLLQPRYEFVAGSGGGLLKARQEVAAAFRWNRESIVTVGWSQGAIGSSSLSAGLEIQFYDVFAIRSGVANLSRIYESFGSPNELQYTGGFGVYHGNVFVDAAATTNRDLGATYRVTLRVPFAGPGR